MIDAIQRNIANRLAAEEAAADYAELVNDGLASLADRAAFWKAFDKATRPELQTAPRLDPAPTKVPVDIVTEDDDFDSLVEEIEHLIESAPDRAQEFVESVQTFVRSVATSVERYGSATANQLTALGNMRDGLQRWCGAE